MFVIQKKLIVVVFINILFVTTIDRIYSQRGLELGAWIGTAQYFGDLNNLYRMNEPGLAAGGIGRYNFNNRTSVRAQLNYERIRASDSKSSNNYDHRRNLSFYSNIIEVAPALEFNFFHYKHGSRTEFYTPYLYCGYSFFYFNPKTKINNQIVSLRELGTEGQLIGQEYYSISGAWLIGSGLKFDLNYRWSINVDIGYRAAATDFLDDVSGVYPNYSELKSTRGDLAVLLADRSLPDENNVKLGISGHQRGDARDRDAFMTIGINLVYFFGKLRCPEISDPH